MAADWRLYQEQVAQFFRELGGIVEVEASVAGVRARHKVDVWVRFTRFGIQQAWVIECKYWNHPVPKEKVLTLKGVVDDVGADRGILIAEVGHQSGAEAMSRNNNITLTTFENLKRSAKNDLLEMELSAMSLRATRAKHKFHDFLRHDKFWQESWGWEAAVAANRGSIGPATAEPKPGVDYDAVFRALGEVGCLQMAVEDVHLQRFPVAVFDDDHRIVADDLESFVATADEILAKLEKFADSQGVNGSTDSR